MAPNEHTSSDHDQAHTRIPQRDEVADAEREARSLHTKKRFWALAASLAVLLYVMISAGPGGASMLSQRLLNYSEQEAKEEKQPAPEPSQQPEEFDAPADSWANGRFALSDFDHHPDLLYQPYLSGPLMEGKTRSSSPHLVSQFRDFLDVYVKRQAVDDNFTIRLIDDRDKETLEVFTLEAERKQYQRTGEADWFNDIDVKRRIATRRLLDKHARRGVPRGKIMVKWGRATQIRDAQTRNRPYLEYEVRLARYLDLDLLTTQIGTVETFNHDEWVSSVGARSRFQMMPYLLNKNNIAQYRLRTATGGRLSVKEEWHPLLVLEPAFKLVKGYANAVGHNVTGLSAYHTGPNNIFDVYRYFMTRAPDWFNPSSSTVMDAYMWATATNRGYNILKANTSFGPFSRGYVASAYGALKALEDIPVDVAETIRAARVQLKPGASVTLSELLTALRYEYSRSVASYESSSETLQGDKTLYELFREMNKHLQLPASETGLVPPAGNVRLVSEVGGHPVRFFLPLGAPEKLLDAGLNILDQEKTFRYDRYTYRYSEADRTVWDRRYERLVEAINQFGFTRANRKYLFQLEKKFEELAQERPTRYRKDQLDIIRIHKQVWSTRQWEELNRTMRSVFGRERMPSRPLAPLAPLDSLQ